MRTFLGLIAVAISDRASLLAESGSPLRDRAMGRATPPRKQHSRLRMNSDDAKRFCLVTPEALLRAFAAIWIFVGLVPESRAAAGTLGLPRGVSDLIPGGGNIAASALSNPNVDGISVRAHWSDVE